MEDEDAVLARFEELKEQSLRPDARLWGSGLWGAWHDFADANYQPAYRFFIERLGDERPAWRQVSLSLLGFHYVLDEAVLSAVRKAAANDEDPGVRMTAAAVLGSQGRFPEPALIKILESDDDALAREAAFSALLRLAGVELGEARDELKKVKTSNVPCRLDDVVRVLKERDLRGPLSVLGKALGRSL